MPPIAILERRAELIALRNKLPHLAAWLDVEIADCDRDLIYMKWMACREHVN